MPPILLDPIIPHFSRSPNHTQVHLLHTCWLGLEGTAPEIVHIIWFWKGLKTGTKGDLGTNQLGKGSPVCFCFPSRQLVGNQFICVGKKITTRFTFFSLSLSSLSSLLSPVFLFSSLSSLFLSLSLSLFSLSLYLSPITALWGDSWNAGIDPRLAVCKANVLTTMLSLSGFTFLECNSPSLDLSRKLLAVWKELTDCPKECFWGSVVWAWHIFVSLFHSATIGTVCELKPHEQCWNPASHLAEVQMSFFWCHHPTLSPHNRDPPVCAWPEGSLLQKEELKQQLNAPLPRDPTPSSRNPQESGGGWEAGC